MLNKLIQMAKQNFDLAFLIAIKHNIENELFNELCCGYDITLDDLKICFSETEKQDLCMLELYPNIDEVYESHNNSSVLIEKIVCEQYGKVYKEPPYHTDIDFSKNLQLKLIDCNTNNLEHINISKNKMLVHLDLSNNKLNSLDVGNNKELCCLFVDENKISSINLTNNEKLIYLKCSNNKISELNLKSNFLLKTLDCSFNKINRLDLTVNTNIINLHCKGNKDLKCIILNKLVKDKIEIIKDEHTEIIYV